MIIKNLLNQVFSVNSETRRNAELNLNSVKKKNIEYFLIELSKIFADEDSHLDTRRMAGLIIKNEIKIHSNNKERNRENKQCLRINNKNRKKIKTNIAKALTSLSKTARRTASQVLSEIIQNELINRKSRKIILFFTEYLKYFNYEKNLFEAILATLQFLSQDASDEIGFKKAFTKISEEILIVVFYAINQNIGYFNGVKIAALSVFSDGIDIFADITDNLLDRNFFLQLFCKQLANADIIVRKITFEIFTKIIQKNYRDLENYIQFLFDFSFIAFGQKVELIPLQAIEFWSEVAEKEFEINTESFQAWDEGRVPSENSFYFTARASTELSKLLCEIIQKKKNEQNDEWNHQSAAGICLNLMCQAAPREVIDQVAHFVMLRLSNRTNSTNTESEILTFGAIFDGLGSRILYQVVYKILPIFTSNLENSDIEIRDITTWIIGKIGYFSSCFLRGNLVKLIRSFFQNIKTDRIIFNSSWALNGIFSFFGKEGNLDWCCEGIILTILKPTLVRFIQEKNTIEFLEILCSMILNSSVREMSYVYIILPFVFKKLKESFRSIHGVPSIEIQMIQIQLCRLINITIQKFGSRIDFSFIKQIIEFFAVLYTFHICPTNLGIEEEVLICIGILSHSYKEQFFFYLENWLQFLMNCILNTENYQISSLSISITGDILRTFGSELKPFAKNVFPLLIRIINSDQIARDIKPIILSCVGDIAFTMETICSSFLDSIISIFKSNFISIKDFILNHDVDSLDFILQTKESMLEGISSILQNDLQDLTGKKIFLKLRWTFELIHKTISEDRTFRIIQLCIGLVGDLSIKLFLFKNLFLNQKWLHQILFECKENEDEKLKNIGKWTENSFKK